jgi:hypothetical protein
VYLRRLARVTLLSGVALVASCTNEPRSSTEPDAARRAASRGDAVPAAIGIVRINEVESNLGDPGDWVELYNDGDTPIDLSGYLFRDNDDLRAYTLPPGTVIAARGFLVLDEAQFGFGLGAADAARLFTPSNELVDGYAWTAHATTTYGRCPDGSGAFATTTLVTKGTANDCGPLIRINEIESSGGVPGDWVELINTTNAEVDLGGYVFRDNSTLGGYVIPNGTTIAANGLLVLDEAQFGFGLGASDQARLFRPGGTVLIDSYTWTEHASTSFGRCPDGVGTFILTAAPTKGTANSCATFSTAVRINEVESNLGTPGDWVELFNTSNAAVDLSGYVFRDNNDLAGYTLPSGSIVPANGFLVLDEAQFGFGLGAADAARLFAPGGATLIDSYTWTAHATTTYGRCPDGTGAFVTTSAVTKGAANGCAPEPTFLPWPGDQSVVAADPGGFFAGNMSGLSYQPLSGLPTGVMWAVRNGPGTLFRLTSVNSLWRSTTRTWSPGKGLRYTDGTGDVDAEGVAVVGSFAYVAAERNNSANAVSRLSILLYDLTAPGATLTAVREWNITADLPPVGANLGLEAITRIPDSYLVSRGFIDESRSAAYNPANYPNNAGGLFFVGVEGTGMIHAYALDHVTGAFTRVASVSSGFPTVMELLFDGELNQLWAFCDNSCNGRSTVLGVDQGATSPTRGRFVVTQRFERPTGMANLNNEGVAFAPLAECVGGRRPVVWSDDGETGGIALRQGFVTCSPF